MTKLLLSMWVALFFLVQTVAVAHPAQQEKQESSLSGKVIETMTSGEYTYARIEKNNQKTWVAVPATKITVGQEVSFMPGAAMGFFESKTLHRTFDNIIFSPGLSGATPRAHGTAMSADEKRAATATDENIKVKKAAGPNAYTINELINKRGKLDKQAVVVRGKVVKVSRNIMGKNWIHLKDGSGDRQEKIVVTSHDLPKVGDVVTAGGILYKDKDFGSGYKYEVIIEEATIK